MAWRPWAMPSWFGSRGPISPSRLSGCWAWRNGIAVSSVSSRIWWVGGGRCPPSRGLLDRAIDGHGAVVGVVGPPGIGKSRLVREVAAMARQRSVEVFTTFCESHASQVPFHAVARLLRAATGVDDLDAQAARDRLRDRVPDADPEDLLLFDDLLGSPMLMCRCRRIDPDARRRRLTALGECRLAGPRNPGGLCHRGCPLDR